jgi:hypothetical protein
VRTDGRWAEEIKLVGGGGGGGESGGGENSNEPMCSVKDKELNE